MLTSHFNLTPTSLFFSASLISLTVCLSISLSLSLSLCLLHKRHKISITFAVQLVPDSTAKQLCCRQISIEFFKRVKVLSRFLIIHYKQLLPRQRCLLHWDTLKFSHYASVKVCNKTACSRFLNRWLVSSKEAELCLVQRNSSLFT